MRNLIISLCHLLTILNDDHFYRPHPKDGEGNVFSLPTMAGGTTVPCSFPVTGLRSFPGSTPVPGSFPGDWSQVLSEGYPSPGRGYPRMGIPPSQDRTVVPNSQVRMGYPSSQVRMWYPLTRRGYPHARSEWGTPPRIEQQSKHLQCDRWYDSCGSRRRTFLLAFLSI